MVMTLCCAVVKQFLPTSSGHGDSLWTGRELVVDMQLLGAAQHENLSTAITAAAIALRGHNSTLTSSPDTTSITVENLRSALGSTVLPGRLRAFYWGGRSHAILNEPARASWDLKQPKEELLLVLDGAHSPESAASLAQSVQRLLQEEPLTKEVVEQRYAVSQGEQ
jgi:folylpolyglutamate synthase/dihydropteroate synthase